VEQALRQLDGRQLNDLYLRTSDDLTFLGICGGAGRYMVTLTDHHDTFARLLNPQDSSETEEDIRCGGQRTPFPRRYLVNFQAALGAAVHYLRTAQAAPELSWRWYQ
jgi:Immunity protein Imm1